MPDMQQIYEFLNSIEGAGYGGMAEFEIAREAARSLAAVPAQGGTTELKKLADGCRAKAELFAKNPNPEVAASFVYVADAIDYILRAPPAEGATSSLVERRPDLMDGDRYSNIDIAKRMWETFNSCGDRWFKYAAQRLERQSPAANAEQRRAEVCAAVAHVLHGRNRQCDYPIYETQDDRGLDEAEYIDFAMDVLASLRSRSQPETGELPADGSPPAWCCKGAAPAAACRCAVEEGELVQLRAQVRDGAEILRRIHAQDLSETHGLGDKIEHFLSTLSSTENNRG